MGENPEGVSWCNNPGFPLKGSVSEPEGEAWVAMVKGAPCRVLGWGALCGVPDRTGQTRTPAEGSLLNRHRSEGR